MIPYETFVDIVETLEEIGDSGLALRVQLSRKSAGSKAGYLSVEDSFKKIKASRVKA